MKYKGQALVIVVVVVMFFLALIWTITFMLENESKWTEKEKRRTVGFHCADTAQAQAYWKISETSLGWDEIITKFNIPSGYDGGTVFVNENGSKYKIHISTGKMDDEDVIIIRTVGTDKGLREVRGIKTIYKRYKAPETAINVKGGISVSGSAEVHWGSIVSKEGDIVVQGSDPRYPRKFAGAGYMVRNAVLGGGPNTRDSNVTSAPHIGPDNGVDPQNQPLDDLYKEWSSNGYREAETVEINLEEYKEKAKRYTPQNLAAISGYTTRIGGYFEGNVTFSNNYFCTHSTAAFYIKNGNATFGSNAYIGPPASVGSGTTSEVSFIVENGNFNSMRNAKSGTPGAGSYVVKVPTSAWKEYQCIDTTNANEYPGDTGFRSTANTYTISGSDPKVVFHGLLYVGGTLNAGSGGKSIVGVVIVKGGGGVTGNVTFWYDKTVDDTVLYSGEKFSRRYWAEFVPGDFNNPDWSK